VKVKVKEDEGKGKKERRNEGKKERTKDGKKARRKEGRKNVTLKVVELHPLHWCPLVLFFYRKEGREEVKEGSKGKR
jgi:hypothetical protein